MEHRIGDKEPLKKISTGDRMRGGGSSSDTKF